MAKREYQCCICKKKQFGYGNNPWPVCEDDELKCCDDCNLTYVLSARLEQVRELQDNEGQQR